MLEACRTCLGLFDVDNLPFYEIEADDVQLSTESCRYKLLSLIPEMALNVTPKSMICGECHGSLETMFEFKGKCLKTENIITQYFRAKPDMDINNLDMKDVSAFNMSQADDVKIAEDKAIEYVGVKEEMESSDFVAVAAVKHEVDDYSSESFEILPPENTDEEDPEFKCTICSKVFKDKATLNSHVVIHSEAKKYQCDVCGKKFHHPSTFKTHTMMHSGVRNHACEYCNKSFVNRGGLKIHLRLHTGEKPFRCEICDHRFTQKIQLTDHLRKHTGERPFVCRVCGMSFYSSQTFKVHERRHNKNTLYICPICNKGYSCNSSLKVHVRTHSDERPYQCETCQKRFKTLDYLAVHRKRHSGTKDVECECCKKLFVHKQDLRNHMMVHTQERPYSCHVCKKTFDRKFRVRQHIMSKHKDVDIDTVVIERFKTSVVGDIKEEIERCITTGPKNAGGNIRARKKAMSLHVKREIIEKYERGVRVADLSRKYGRSSSMICTVLKQKESIKAIAPAKGVTIISKLRTSLHDNMEKLLMAWLTEKRLQGDALTQVVIREKARAIYDDLVKRSSTDEVSGDSFKASRGWFDNFRKRTGIHAVVNG